MSIKVLDAILRAYHACASMKLVLLILGNHARDDGTHIWPGIDRIAACACLDQRNVRRILNALCRDGVLVKVRSGGGRRRATEYAIALDNIANAPFGTVNGKRSKTRALASSFGEENPGANVIENPGAGVTDLTETRALVSENPGAGAPPTVMNHHISQRQPSVNLNRQRARRADKPEPVRIDEPNDDHRARAKRCGLDVDREFEQWRLNRQAKGLRPYDEAADFSAWLMRSEDFKPTKPKEKSYAKELLDQGAI